ncbi:hypothetical protein [Microbispora siamensis]|uniref:hypothetical protein n=1 Tax=Microbispora siamensis TaxID=564413 RepID=UPI00194E9D05|nr:hypothetical protein [Microbispora siamensis]
MDSTFAPARLVRSRARGESLDDKPVLPPGPPGGVLEPRQQALKAAGVDEGLAVRQPGPKGVEVEPTAVPARPRLDPRPVPGDKLLDISWLITCSGSGNANDVFRSVCPSSAKPSTSRCARSRIHGSYRASRRGMKNVLTAARSRS